MGPRGALGVAESATRPGAEDGQLDEGWEGAHRRDLAAAILASRTDQHAARDADRARAGWSPDEIALGRRGVCRLCVNTPYRCSPCGIGIGAA